MSLQTRITALAQAIAGQFNSLVTVPDPSAESDGRVLTVDDGDLIYSDPASGVPAGFVGMFARSGAPSGWLKADGSAVSTTTYSDLADAIYCGDSDNATAEWGYKATSSSNPGSNRSTSGTFIVLPDLRAEFMRGLDDGRGEDSGRSLWAHQDDAFQGHHHDLTSNAKTQGGGHGGGPYPSAESNATQSVDDPISDGSNGTPRTASETRPRNIALLACIKT